MGKYRFTRAVASADARTNTINFDSSPRYSITKQYGYSQANGDFELRETRKDHRYVYYDVLAARTAGGNKTVAGELREETSESLMERYG